MKHIRTDADGVGRSGPDDSKRLRSDVLYSDHLPVNAVAVQRKQVGNWVNSLGDIVLIGIMECATCCVANPAGRERVFCGRRRRCRRASSGRANSSGLVEPLLLYSSSPATYLHKSMKQRVMLRFHQNARDSANAHSTYT
jgi:hypothetical protein